MLVPHFPQETPQASNLLEVARAGELLAACETISGGSALEDGEPGPESCPGGANLPAVTPVPLGRRAPAQGLDERNRSDVAALPMYRTAMQSEESVSALRDGTTSGGQLRKD